MSPPDEAGVGGAVVDDVDPAFAALLADPRTAMRRPPPSLPLADLRHGANAFMAAAPRIDIHAVEDLAGGPVPMRLYRPAPGTLPVVLFLHGGGFVLGDLETHDALCRSLAAAARVAVIAVDYRLAPEHPFPAAHDDANDALTWVVANAAALELDATRIAVAGDSAGGHLAVGVALATAVPLRHLALIYPLLDPAGRSESMSKLASGYLLTASFLEWAWELLAAGAVPDDVRWDASRADPARLPAATVVTAAFDPLLDEGEAFAARLERAGVAVRLRRFPGMIHGFVGLPQLTPVAQNAIEFIAEGIRAAFTTDE